LEGTSIGLHQKKKKELKKRAHDFSNMLGFWVLSLSLYFHFFSTLLLGVSFNAACQGFIIQFAWK
jgi:hypothetical protein